MAATFGILHEFKGATVKQYENTVKVVDRDGGKGLPPGQLSHIAGLGHLSGSDINVISRHCIQLCAVTAGLWARRSVLTELVQALGRGFVRRRSPSRV
jgi:hypothetical protein